jgi:hypothetical protein
MNDPSKELIDSLKSNHADRSLLLVEIDHEGETYKFLMTGPSDVEYRKFVGEVLDAKNKDKESEQLEAVRMACSRAALAQIRWPERSEVEVLFKRFPAFPHKFREKLHDAAGSSAEVRSKKL